MSGECGVDQGKSPDAPEEHQQNENALRQRTQLRRQPQCQPYRSGSGSRFIEADAQRQALRSADDRCTREGQSQIQQQDGGGVFDGGILQPAPEKLRLLPAVKYGGGIGGQHSQRRDLHAARSGAGCAAGKHQQNRDRLRGIAHLRQIRGVVAGCSRRDRLKERRQHPLACGQGGKIRQEEQDRRKHDQKRRRAQNGLALHPVSSQVQPVGADVIPRQKADAAHDDQQHNDDVDQRVGHVRRQGSVERICPPQNVKARVAEGGNGVKHRHPHAPQSVVPAEYRQQRQRADQLHKECALQDKTCQAHDAAHRRSGNGVLHGAALLQ